MLKSFTASVIQVRNSCRELWKNVRRLVRRVLLELSKGVALSWYHSVVSSGIWFSCDVVRYRCRLYFFRPRWIINVFIEIDLAELRKYVNVPMILYHLLWQWIDLCVVENFHVSWGDVVILVILRWLSKWALKNSLLNCREGELVFIWVSRRSMGSKLASGGGSTGTSRTCPWYQLR